MSEPSDTRGSKNDYYNTDRWYRQRLSAVEPWDIAMGFALSPVLLWDTGDAATLFRLAGRSTVRRQLSLQWRILIVD